MSNKKHNINIKDGKNKNHEPENETEEKEEVTAESSEQTGEDKDTEIARLKDTLLRKMAEFENYKRRTDSEISSYIKYASEKLIKELIPVYDDLGRSIDSINKGETKDFDTLKTGIALIYDKFKNVLEKEGLKEIDSLGKEFDVDLSSALMQVPSKDVKPNTVIEVIEKGYKLKDKVVKHEKVLVSSEPN